MTKYYVLLNTELFIPLGNQYADAYWRKNEKRNLLKATCLEQAIDEGLEAFLSYRDLHFRYLDTRYSESKKIELKKAFPSEVIVIKETEHKISV